jgi:hypothetical protein
MRASRRTFLFAMSAVVAIVVFYLGMSFTRGAVPSDGSYGSIAFWLLAAVILAAPLWIPAALSAQADWVANVINWICAAAMLIPLGFAASVVLHQFHLYPYPLFSAAIFSVALGICAGCMLAIVLLLLPTALRAQSGITCRG